MKILLAVDGSKSALDAVDFVIQHAAQFRQKPQVELVTVHRPVPKLPGMGAAVSKGQIERYYEEEGAAALAEAKKRLDGAGLAYEPRVLVGPAAETLIKHAQKSGCDLIAVGSPKALIGSVATKVLHTSGIPVLLVK
jgi:nucleotide-binding universal stress UspA family protein